MSDAMSDEHSTREEELALAQEEISRLKRRLADERFAEELKDALTLAAAAGSIASRSAALFLIDEEAEELVFEVALGPEAEQVRELRVPLGHGIAGLVAASGQPMGQASREAPRVAFG